MMNVGHVAKSLIQGMPTLLTGGIPSERAGDERLTFNRIFASDVIGVQSPAFGPGEPIPSHYSAEEGTSVSPPLSWLGVPSGARSIAIVVEDPDAPTPNPFVHWLAYNIPPEAGGLPEGWSGSPDDPPGLEGKNSTLKLGYIDAAPPKGDLPHHYHFCVFAVSKMLELDAGAGRNALVEALKPRVIGKGRLVGTYQR